MEQYLETLGLEPGKEYTIPQVKKAWRDKVSGCHPDKGGDKGTFLAVMHAYKMLSDASYRQQEDMKPRPNLDIHFRIAISFEDAFFGRSVTLAFNRPTLGPDMQPLMLPKEEVSVVVIACPAGKMQEYSTVHAGMGCRQGDTVGNALISIQPKGHPLFQVQGTDVVSPMQVPLDLMLKGGDLVVHTMYGFKTLKVPAGTAPNDSLVIPRAGVGGRGNHVVRLQPIYPTKEELKKPAWTGLGINWREQQPVEPKEEQDIFTLFERLKCSPSNSPPTGRYRF